MGGMNEERFLLGKVFPYLDEVLKQSETWKDDSSRCAWADEIIRAQISAVLAFRDCDGFYCGRDRIEPDALVSARLEEEVTGLIWIWQKNLKWGFEHLTGQPNDEQIKLLNLTTSVFERQLLGVPGIESESFIPVTPTGFLASLKDWPASREKPSQGARADALDYIWNLMEAAYRLKVCEYEVWLKHTEWKISGFADMVGDSCDFREYIDNKARALAEFDAAHFSLFYDLRTAHEGLMDQIEGAPVAFVRIMGRAERRVSFARQVKAVLTCPIHVFFENPISCLADEGFGQERFQPSHPYYVARAEFLTDLREYFEVRAKHSRKESAARRLWYEAAAEILSVVSWEQPVFSEEEADRVIACAHAAQRESWIQRKLDGKDDDGPKFAPGSEPPPDLAPVNPKVDLAPTSLETLKTIIADLVPPTVGIHVPSVVPPDSTQIGRHVALVKDINAVMEGLRQIAAAKDAAIREPTYKSIATAVNTLHKDDPSWKKVTDDAIGLHVERAIGRTKIDARNIASGRDTVSGTSVTIKSKMERLASKREYYTDTTLCLYWAAFVLQSKTFAKAKLKRIRAVAAAIQPDEDAFLEAVQKIQQNWRA